MGERQTRGATGLSGIYTRLGALEASVAALNTGMQEVLVHLRSARPEGSAHKVPWQVIPQGYAPTVFYCRIASKTVRR